MNTVLIVIAQVVGIILLADFAAGVVHWLEDAYGSEETPVVGKLLIRPNIVHHHFPRFFTKLTWWQSSWDLVLLGAGVLLLGWWLGFLSWQLWLFVLVSINANQVHKWSHRTRKENGRIISFLQDIYILQTPKQHAVHHTDPKNTYYCPITNLLNPVLERIEFWTRLERIIARVTGIEHRHDTSNRGAGPAPEWLVEFRPARSATSTISPATTPALVTTTTPPAANASKCVCAKCPGVGRCARKHHHAHREETQLAA